MDLGRIGIWWSGAWKADDEGIDVAAEIESLGYGAIWSSGRFEPGISDHFAQLLQSTSTIPVLSGVVSIWACTPEDAVRGTTALEERFPGRFQLGIGASHSVATEHYTKPFSGVRRYLDALDSDGATVSRDRRLLAALGPRMLELAAARSLGAHPYFVPAEHTERARAILGPDAILAPEVTVVVESDPGKAREVARLFTAGYLRLENYASNLRSLGFSEEDLADAGSDRLVDAVVCWGDPQSVAVKVRRHLEAGADHVCVQVVNGDRGSFPINEYRELAGVLLS